MAKITVSDEYTAEGRRMKKVLEELDKLACFIGFQREDYQEEEDENGNKKPNMTDIAAWNELGTSQGIPSRPFIRNTVDLHKEEINACLDQMVLQVLNGATAEQVLREMGEYLKEKMQLEIIDGSYVPNKPSTIRRKKSDKPLIDTGRMSGGVNYQIKKKGSF